LPDTRSGDSVSDIEMRFNADALIKKLESMGQVARLRDAVQAAALDLVDKLVKYPPSGPWNSPGRTRMVGGHVRKMGYYIRGTGYVSASGKVYRISETLNRRWTSKMLGAPDIGAEIGNNASYAKYVQGDEQAYFHKDRGWSNARQVLDDNRDRLMAFIVTAVQRMVE